MAQIAITATSPHEAAPYAAAIESRGGQTKIVVPKRFTSLDADTVIYEYTVTDPTEYTAPYTVMMPLRRTDGPIFEYACHEGNIGMHGILAGARELERQGRELRR